MHAYDFDILTVSETWLDARVLTTHVSIPGFTFIRCDRTRSGRLRGGGVGIYVRDAITYSIIDCNVSLPLPNSLEIVGIFVYLRGKNLAVLSAYRPPNSLVTDISALDGLFSDIFMRTEHVICLGDFNIDCLKTNSVGFANLRRTLNFFSLEQLVTEPTRVVVNSATLLDLIICSRHLHAEVSDVSVADSFGISDHCIVSCCLRLESVSTKAQMITRRILSTMNDNAFALSASHIDWAGVVRVESLDNKVEFITSAIIELFDEHAPLRTFRVTRKPAPWFTTALRLFIKKKNVAFAKYRRLRSADSFAYYKQLRSACKSMLRKEKQFYFGFTLDKLPSKHLWQGLRAAGAHSTKENNSVMDQRFPDPDVINDYFVDSLPDTSISPAILDFFLNNSHSVLPSDFSFQPISSTQLFNTIRSMKLNGSGADGITGSMLLYCLPYCFDALVHIINFSLAVGEFPALWKTGLVRPIPKSENPSTLRDLRPITILSHLSKIMEKICYKQLYEFLCSRSVLPKFQSGFRSGHSTTTALVQIAQQIFTAIDYGQATVLVLLDFSKAFDTIDHDLLLAKLSYYGLSSLALAWFKGYLFGRSQRVLATTTGRPCLSGVRSVRRGVPQGSVLGPLLFNLYVADLLSLHLHCFASMYADDTQLLRASSILHSQQAQDEINSDLGVICAWAQDNALLLNPSKSTAIIIGSPVMVASFPPLHLEVYGVQLQFQQSVRNLGLLFDERFTFQDHVRAKCFAAFSRLRTLYPYRHYFSTRLKLRLSQALIISLFDYASVVYFPCLTAQLRRRVQVVQNSCLRFSYGIRKREHISPAFSWAGWLDAHGRWVYLLCILVHTVRTTGDPPYLSELLRTRADYHSSSSLITRAASQFVTPMYRSAKFRASFKYSAAHYYNKLPDDLKSLTLPAFKVALFAHLRDFGAS